MWQVFGPAPYGVSSPRITADSPAGDTRSNRIFEFEPAEFERELAPLTVHRTVALGNEIAPTPSPGTLREIEKTMGGSASCEARDMNYEEFKALWIWALRESGLPIGGVTPIEESLDLRSTDRHCKSLVFANDHVATFHTSAVLEFRWDALQTARTRGNEEDLVRQLLGLDRGQYPRTEVPRLRVDVTLSANTGWGNEIPLPSAEVWKSWVRETIGRLENIEPLLPIEQVRENRKGNLEILAFRSEPELNVLCKPDGSLVLRGVEVAAWQAINLPRKWDDSSRKPDKAPHEELAALFRRLSASLHGWREALDHLAPTN